MNDAPRYCRERVTPMGLYVFSSLVIAYLALVGAAIYSLRFSDKPEPVKTELSSPSRIGPMVVKAGEENDPWVFDEGRNVYVPAETTDPRFIHEPTGLACQCGCGQNQGDN